GLPPVGPGNPGPVRPAPADEARVPAERRVTQVAARRPTLVRGAALPRRSAAGLARPQGRPAVDVTGLRVTGRRIAVRRVIGCGIAGHRVTGRTLTGSGVIGCRVINFWPGGLGAAGLVIGARIFLRRK